MLSPFDFYHRRHFSLAVGLWLACYSTRSLLSAARIPLASPPPTRPVADATYPTLPPRAILPRRLPCCQYMAGGRTLRFYYFLGATFRIPHPLRLSCSAPHCRYSSLYLSGYWGLFSPPFALCQLAQFCSWWPASSAHLPPGSFDCWGGSGRCWCDGLFY